MWGHENRYGIWKCDRFDIGCIGPFRTCLVYIAIYRISQYRPHFSMPNWSLYRIGKCDRYNKGRIGPFRTFQLKCTGITCRLRLLISREQLREVGLLWLVGEGRQPRLVVLHQGEAGLLSLHGNLRTQKGLVWHLELGCYWGMVAVQRKNEHNSRIK